jgi:hypothetical protein
MMSFILVLSSLFAIESVQAQPPADYLTRVCERNVIAAVLKKYKKNAEIGITEYVAWDKKTKEASKKYTGTFSVETAVTATECYEGWQVETKILYPEGARTPSCTIKKVTFISKECA